MRINIIFVFIMITLIGCISMIVINRIISTSGSNSSSDYVYTYIYIYIYKYARPPQDLHF